MRKLTKTACLARDLGIRYVALLLSFSACAAELEIAVRTGSEAGGLNVRSPHCPGDLFDFRTCEGIVVGSKDFGLFQVKLPATLGDGNESWRRDDKVWRYSWPYAQGVTVHIDVEPDGESLKLKYTLQNTSTNALDAVQLHTCIRTTEAPAFFPPPTVRNAQTNWSELYDRLHVWSGDRHFTFAETKLAASEPRLSLMQNGAVPVKWGRWVNSPETFDPPLIALTSRDRKKTIALAFERAIWASSNTGDDRACFHLFPWFGRIEPGQSVTVHGRLYVLKGGPQEALQCFKEDFHQARLDLFRDFRLDDATRLPVSSPAPGLSFEARSYPEHNATEWQVRLQNPAVGEAPLFDDVKSADFVVQFPSDKPVTLHWNKGSHSDITDFQPRIETLSPGWPFALESYGGRSSDGVMPYFNLASDGGGLIVAVGWSGDWKASFEALSEDRVRITAGLKRSRFRLRAGEQVRLPSVLVMAYRGDWLEGQNQFRRLMLRHITPTNHPPTDLMPVAASVHGMIGFNDTTETNLTALARAIAALKLPLDTYWLDAGWTAGGFPLGQGNPNADSFRFPRGLAPVGAAARKAGLRFLAWFEPERVMRGSWLEREHSVWLLQPSGTPPELRYQEKDGFRLLDLGDPVARTWAIENISAQIQTAGIAIYRHDFNLYPDCFWHTQEETNRIGLREIRYITGLYDYLDELVRRHPGLILDNCASGGRRLDFEMVRRCVALWRSDSCWGEKTFPRNVQAMTHGLSLWLPLHGLGAAATDDTALRSGMGACASFAINFRDPQAVAALRKHLDRYLKVRPLFAADYYPLTQWSDDPSQWIAFQFHDSEKGEGLVQAFCGAAAAPRSFTLRLKGLAPDRRYTITDWDAPAVRTERRGADLLHTGIEVRAKENDHQAIVLHYTSRRQPPASSR